MHFKPNHCFSSPRAELIRACIPEQTDNWRTWLPQGTSHGIGNAEQQQQSAEQPAEAEDQPMESSTAPQEQQEEEHAEEEIE
jgi:hypothetical protein